jgi:hypothetical protein
MMTKRKAAPAKLYDVVIYNPSTRVVLAVRGNLTGERAGVVQSELWETNLCTIHPAGKYKVGDKLK